MLRFRNKPLQIDDEIEDLSLQQEIHAHHEITIKERQNREQERKEACQR